MSARNLIVIIAALGLLSGGYLLFLRPSSTNQSSTLSYEQTVPISNAPVDEDVSNSLTLTNVGSVSLPLGTHRPELLAATDGTFYVVVVEPKGEFKHWAYHYDADWQLIDQPFAVSATTEEYGEPADHRAMLFGDQLVVIYQTNLWKDGPPPAGATGPMEDYALNQSLILARFTLDGQLVKRVPIVANAESGSGENFPDFAITWFNNHITITTGTGEQKLKIRQIDTDGNILSTAVYSVAPGSAISNEIGNSLFTDSAGLLNLVSGNGPGSTQSLVVTTFDASGQVSASVRLPSNGREETFPTDNTGASGYQLIAYISRASGGSADVESNSYNPYLKILDADLHVLADVQIGQGGFLHIHPTVTVSGGSVFVAWSKQVEGRPQVQIEELTIAGLE